MSLLQFLNNGYFAGKVGIGTESPTSLLEISKQLSAASTIDYPYTISSRDDNNSINQAGGEGVGIKFRIAGNAATTPGDSLVGASIAAIRESSSDTDSSTGLGFFVTQNNETLDEALRIDHDGKVGIGTASPDAKLDIEGDFEAEYALKFTNTKGTGTISGFRSHGVNGEDLSLYNGANRIQRWDENGDSIFDGNVGIGTSNPSSQLSIGSNVITTKKPTVVIADGVAGGSLVIRGLSPILSFDRTGASPENKILMDGVGLEFKTGTLDAEGDVDFKINPDGDLQLSKGAKISNQENTDIDSAAAEVVAEVAISYTAAFFDFVVKKGTNVRSGTVYACHDGTNVEFTETSTNDLGDTSDVTLSVDKTSTNLRLIATVTSNDWSVKSLIRAI